MGAVSSDHCMMFGDGKRHQGFVNLAKLCVFRQGFVPWQPAKR